MFCKKCGTEIGPTDKFCPECGTAVFGQEVASTVNVKDIEPGKVVKTKKGMKRCPFILFTLLFFVVSFLFSAVNGAFERSMSETDEPLLLLIFGVIGLLPLVFLILYVYFCVAGRLRDCGKNTYLAWVAIIPLVGFFFVIYLFFPDSKETAAPRSPQQL